MDPMLGWPGLVTFPPFLESSTSLQRSNPTFRPNLESHTPFEAPGKLLQSTFDRVTDSAIPGPTLRDLSRISDEMYRQSTETAQYARRWVSRLSASPRRNTRSKRSLSKRGIGSSSSASSHKKKRKRKRVVYVEKPSPTNGMRTRRYVRLRLLGKGGFATVWVVKLLRDRPYASSDNIARLNLESFENRPSSSLYALKSVSKASLRKAPRHDEKLRAEIEIHSGLHNPHVCSFVRSFEDSRAVHILLEFCPLGSIADVLKFAPLGRLDEPSVRYLLRQLIIGLKYLHHDKRVIHRDLKLGNLFLSEDLKVKIGDFGLAATIDFDGEKKKTLCGTPNYIAPEIISSSGRGHSYPVDIWSLGVVLYTLLFGQPPFETASVQTTYRYIRQTKYSFPLAVRISRDAKDLVRQILRRLPSERPSLDDCANHPFLAPRKDEDGEIPDLLKRYAKSRAAKGYCRGNFSWEQEHAEGSGKERKASPVVSARTPKKQKKKKKREAPKNENDDPLSSSSSSCGRKKNGGLMPAQLPLPSGTPCPPTGTTAIGARHNPKLSQPTVWVTSFQCFTQYGLAYTLSNGLVGAYFNDASMMLFDRVTSRVMYCEKTRKTRTEVACSLRHSPRVPYPFKIFTLDQHSAGLKKKCVLISYFDAFFRRRKSRRCRSRSSASPGSSDGSPRIMTVAEPKAASAAAAASRLSEAGTSTFVKHWIRKPQAILFRFSNKTIQLVFSDASEVILSDHARVVTYKAPTEKNQDPKAKLDPVARSRTTFLLDDFLGNPDDEVTRRLRFTKELLRSLIKDT